MADAPVSYVIVIVIFAVLVALLFTMREKYSKLRNKRHQLTKNEGGLDVSSWDDIIHGCKYH
ncbi:MAG: hypothetical protein M3O68_01305 [Thermoproteota archaeon]|nr:hypothetical protein [Thermoproteota archaeon]